MSFNKNNHIKVTDVLNHLMTQLKGGVKFYGPKESLQNKIRTFAINRPGITLSGYFKDFSHERVQLFGRGEFNYLKHLSEQGHKQILIKFLNYRIPCCIFTNNNIPDPLFLKMSRDHGIPVIVTKGLTGQIENIVKEFLQEKLADKKQFHGVMVEVFGIGILIMGQSGVGKSESALELITRGHRLIADDLVIVHKFGGTSLVAQAHELIKYFLEIRGIGIVDIKSLFGVGAVREKKSIDLVVILEEWIKNKNYERLGLKRKNYSILDVKVPLLIIPVKPGRNIPVIIETIAKNIRLEHMGINTPLILNSKILHILKGKGNE